MKNISVQQNAIMALWNRSLELEVEVQEQVKQVEHDSGLKVQDYVELVQDVDMSSREHHAKGDQQPREKNGKEVDKLHGSGDGHGLQEIERERPAGGCLRNTYEQEPGSIETAEADL